MHITSFGVYPDREITKITLAMELIKLFNSKDETLGNPGGLEKYGLSYENNASKARSDYTSELKGT